MIQSLDYWKEQNLEHDLDFFLGFRNGQYVSCEFHFDEEVIGVKNIFNANIKDAMNISVTKDFVMYIQDKILYKDDLRTHNGCGQCLYSNITLK